MKTTNHYKKFIGSFFLISLFSVSILNAQSIDLADDFLDSLNKSAIIETVRTGALGIGRGDRILKI